MRGLSFLVAGSAIVLVALGGCIHVPTKHRMPYNPCRAAGAQFAIGRAYDSHLGRRALHASGAKVLMVIQEGGIFTSDYRTNRLRLQLDASGRVYSVECS